MVGDTSDWRHDSSADPLHTGDLGGGSCRGGDLGAELKGDATVPSGGPTIALDSPDQSAPRVMARARRAVVFGLAVLAVLQAADVFADMGAVGQRRGRAQSGGPRPIGSGGAIFVKFAIIGALLAW